MEESAILERVYKIEQESRLEEEIIKGVPLWRIFRYCTRLYYINNQVGYVANTGSTIAVGPRRLKLFSGFWKHLFSKDLTLLFTFNRLAFSNGQYLDKFLDPVIEMTSLKEQNYVIVDPRNYSGNYPRVHKHNSVSGENRTLFMQALKYFFILGVPIAYKRKVRCVFDKARDAFGLPNEYIKTYYKSLALFLANYYYYMTWLKVLKPKRVFIVYRESYFGLIAACKRLGIHVAEFQHGITLDNTVSFTGTYDQRIDPDYFLVFGEYWKGSQFGMPLNRIVNIGWAYSKYLQQSLSKSIEKHNNEVLVISSPEISDAILDALQELSKSDGIFSFDIRLHPCESYNELQQQKLKSIPKARVVDNKTDSALVLPTYKYVVGENSSVIYEALSIGCNVGMLNMCGLRPAIDLPGIKDNFFIINNSDDFGQFLNEDRVQPATRAEFYSEFDSKRFMKFIENKM